MSDTPAYSPENPFPETAPEASRRKEDTDHGVTASSREIPMNVRLRRVRAWLRYWRIRLAKAVLLPELSASEAHAIRQNIYEEGKLTSGYVLMSALSAGIATLGLLQGSTAVVIGAMLVSPLMSPIAALGFGFSSIDGSRIRDAARVVAIGAGIGILTAVLITWVSPIRDPTPEILARTQPTLLDLAIALFSGIAGGYASVIGKGGTAIGVAIATALMPPLAVVGYGIGMLEWTFALGALLLFLTNLAAITLSFALIARLSGVARPLFRVEWKPRYIVFLITAFLLLAVPLSMTLIRITQEAAIRNAARTAILETSGGKTATIAQMDVSWPLFGDPAIDALVIAPTYSPNAERQAEERVAEMLGRVVQIHLQQVQTAGDQQSNTRAMVEAAMERTTAGIAADVPPYDKIRASIGLPANSIWTNRAERRVYIEPASAPGWTLFDYAKIEIAANKVSDRWNVRVLPPPRSTLRVHFGDPENAPEGTVTPEIAGWALLRWGMASVVMETPDSDIARAFIQGLAKKGIKAIRIDPREPPARPRNGETPPPEALLRVYSISPTRAAELAREKAEAEAEAARKKAEAEREAPEREPG
jgi:uncharacterized hydrophobic protein (TIGR00271 family)